MAWLDRHLPLLVPPTRLVLELGCGPGNDAAQLAAAGLDVVATDLSTSALGRASGRLGTRAVLRVDHARPLPFRDASFDAVVASLTLHYFEWDVTRAAVGEIRRVLRPEGAFVFRVNATDDVEHGAEDGEEVGRHLRRYPDGRYETLKRFFDADEVRAALTGRFDIEALTHVEIDWYGRVKRTWECRARAT